MFHTQSSLVIHNKARADSLENELSSSLFLLADYRDRMETSYVNDRIAINGNDTIIANGKKMLLKSVLNENSLYVKISSSNCWSCIKSISQYINNNVIPPNREIVFLLETQNDSLTERLVQYAEIKRPVYITRKGLNLPVDSIGDPYLFCVDKENKTRMVMMPITKDEKLTTLYFKILK